MAAAPWIVSDGLWELVEPLLPKRERRFRYPDRKRLPDRETLQGNRSCFIRGSPASTCRPGWASSRASPAGGV
jgi:transposase